MENGKWVNPSLFIDFKMLREQKINILEILDDNNLCSPHKESLEGILGLIDAIQDQALNELSEEEVFGDFDDD